MSARRAALAGLAAIAALVACESATGPEYVERVTIQPDSLYLEVGQTATFEAIPIGPRDQLYPDRASRVEWSLSNDGVVTLERTGDVVTVQALALGSSQVIGALGRGEGRAPVHVQPAGLASIEIQPSPIQLRLRTGTQIRAVLRDASGQQMSPEGFRVSWVIDNEDVVSQSDNERKQPISSIFARGVGSTRLRLIVGPLSVSTGVQVTN